jgi:hypothetical protein
MISNWKSGSTRPAPTQGAGPLVVTGNAAAINRSYSKAATNPHPAGGRMHVAFEGAQIIRATKVATTAYNTMTDKSSRFFRPELETQFGIVMKECPNYRISCTGAEGRPVIEIIAVNGSGTQISVSAFPEGKWFSPNGCAAKFLMALGETLIEIAAAHQLGGHKDLKTVLSRVTMDATLVVCLEWHSVMPEIRADSARHALPRSAQGTQKPGKRKAMTGRARALRR